MVPESGHISPLLSPTLVCVTTTLCLRHVVASQRVSQPCSVASSAGSGPLRCKSEDDLPALSQGSHRTGEQVHGAPGMVSRSQVLVALPHTSLTPPLPPPTWLLAVLGSGSCGSFLQLAWTWTVLPRRPAPSQVFPPMSLSQRGCPWTPSSPSSAPSALRGLPPPNTPCPVRHRGGLGGLPSTLLVGAPGRFFQGFQACVEWVPGALHQTSSRGPRPPDQPRTQGLGPTSQRGGSREEARPTQMRKAGGRVTWGLE